MGRLLHTCCGLGPAPHLPQSNPLSAVTSRFLLSRNLNPKSANNGALAPQWGDIETGGEGDDLKPQTTPPSPRVSKKKDPESRLFHLNYYACLRHPLGAYLNPNPVRPAYLAATTDGQGHRRVSHLRSGCTKPGQNPRMSTQCPPSTASPAPAATPGM